MMNHGDPFQSNVQDDLKRIIEIMLQIRDKLLVISDMMPGPVPLQRQIDQLRLDYAEMKKQRDGYKMLYQRELKKRESNPED